MRQYHDIDSSTKVRGQGIGFAEVGIKLGLLVYEGVFTETRGGSTHVAEAGGLCGRSGPTDQISHRRRLRSLHKDQRVDKRGRESFLSVMESSCTKQ